MAKNNRQYQFLKHVRLFFYGSKPRYRSKHFRGRTSGNRKNRFLTQAQISRKFPFMTQGFKSGQGF